MNPEFVFDVGQSNIVDACLSLVNQTFIDHAQTGIDDVTFTNFENKFRVLDQVHPET